MEQAGYQEDAECQIMMSYALLAFIMLNGILALCLRKKEPENNVSENDNMNA